MKLRQETIVELGIILNEEFNLKLQPKELNDFAYYLVTFFDALLKFESTPTRSIDKEKLKVDDQEGK